MQITFDPHSPEDLATLARLLGTAAPAQHDTAFDAAGTGRRSQPSYWYDQTETAPDAPAQPDQTDTADQPDTLVWTPVAEGAPQYIQGEVTHADDTDIHGMTHDDAIHSTPASKNADGSWRAKRGQKEAYEAAIAAKTAPTHVMPTGMPTPQPAAAAPATPPAPIDYKTMADRFVAKMSDPEGLPSDYETIYAALQIGYADLETNQTSIARLDAYMDSVDEGNDHDQSVRRALGMV